VAIALIYQLALRHEEARMERQIAIRTFPTRTEAELVRGLLESAGIPAWVSTDDAGGLYPSFDLADGARVMIRESDQEAAANVLTTSD
jgi:hypothetical protein